MLLLEVIFLEKLKKYAKRYFLDAMSARYSRYIYDDYDPFGYDNV